MASSESSTTASEFLERLRARFTRPQGYSDPGEASAGHRGRVITLCLLISVVLWFTLSMRETYTLLIEMPTEVVNVPEDVALAEPPPRTVQLQVRGEGVELFGLRLNRPPVQIDASSDEVALDELAFDLPKGVVLENVSPRLFNLKKERRVARTIPLVLRGTLMTTGTEELLYPPRLDPDSIRVSGARSIINELVFWPTVPVDEAIVKDSLVLRVALSDTLDGLVNKSHVSTTLSAVARPFTEGRRTFRVQVTGVPSNQRVVSLEPSTVTVTYRVPISQFDEAQRAQDLFATVAYDVIRADTTGRVRPRLHAPPNLVLRNVEIRPATLRYYERLVEQ